MPVGERGGRGRRLVVWTAGGALLAVPLEDTVEIAALDDDGRTTGRAGPLEPVLPPGLTADRPARAVVVRHPAGPLALAAEAVEGVSEGAETTAPTPSWLGGLRLDHLDGLVLLEDGRIAALLAVERLAGP